LIGRLNSACVAALSIGPLPALNSTTLTPSGIRVDVAPVSFSETTRTVQPICSNTAGRWRTGSFGRS
jgi:hypothetical protein